MVRDDVQMQQLTPLDASFITETTTTFQHICDILIFEAKGPSLSIEELRRIVEQRLHLLPPLRRRLIEVPYGMDEPYWIEDPDFDLSNHLYEAALPAPGNDRQLADLAAAIGGGPLDRRKPLWEVHLVHGVEGGRKALIKKFHHAAVDGVSGLEITAILLDTSPEPREVPPPSQPWKPDPLPTRGEMTMRGWSGMARRPRRMFKVQRRRLETLPQSSVEIEDGGLLSAPSRKAPPTPLNVTVSGKRSVAFGSVSLGDVRAIKKAFDTTINDVVIAISAAAVRRWLKERNALPAEPLLVCVPVSVRTEAEPGEFGNRVSILIAELPTHLADPIERLRAAHEAMKVAKDEHKAIGANVLADRGEFSMPMLQARASRAMAQLMPPTPDAPIKSNISVSNLPGSRVPLYLSGHKLQAHYAVGKVDENQALMITVASYLDNVGFGLVADPDVVPDLWAFVGMLTDALQELSAAVPSS
jgi:diacylglycerol O-acyltransferase / wax synthase